MRLLLVLAPALIAFGLLAACDSPSPAVSRWNRATIETGGMRFGVHWNKERAEAYRVSKHLYPHLSEVAANAVVAIEQASGCKVRKGSLGGDAAIVKARLTCPGTPEKLPASPKLRVAIDDCVAGDGHVHRGLATDYTEIDCGVTVTTEP